MYEYTNEPTRATVAPVAMIGGIFERFTGGSSVSSRLGRSSSAIAVAAVSRVIQGSASDSRMSGVEQSRYARLRRSRLSGPEPRHGTVDSARGIAEGSGRDHGPPILPPS